MINRAELEQRFQTAIACFWEARHRQKQKQLESGKKDAGSRGAVTGGAQMDALEALVADILRASEIKDCEIRTRTALELPGYYRPEKQWDLLVLTNDRLVAAVEFKSQIGPSFGNNFNNRCEEAIGSAADIWVAYREGRFGHTPAPFLGYFFLLEDCPAVHRPINVRKPFFAVDAVFRDATYAERYTHLCRRLVSERLYNAACLAIATNTIPPNIRQPAEDLGFVRFVAALTGHAVAFTSA